MARILVIEDEPDLQTLLAYNLRQAGHLVECAGTAAAGLAQARRTPPQLLLLDLMLPDGSGLDVCKALKRELRTQAIPVLFLTAKGEEIDRVLGFELGAEDYVVKPFSVRELLLRIEAVLRRTSQAPPDAECIRVGELTLERAAHRVIVAGTEVPLTALEFKLLLTLYERGERVQSREVLLADVWEIHADITTRTVDTHIKRLREKLGVAGSYIETVRGIGYRFQAPAKVDS